MKFKSTMLALTLLASTCVVSGVYAQTKEQQKEIQQDASQLSPDKAKMYNDAMQAAADANKDLRTKIHQVHEEADAILVAEKFDKAAFLAKANELDQLYGQTRAKMNDAFVSVAEKLTQEDRKILLKARNDHHHN